MTFNQILPHLLKGKFVRRKGWYQHSKIQFVEHQKFIQLSSDLGKRNWSPYQEDFTAKDWEIVNETQDKSAAPSVSAVSSPVKRTLPEAARELWEDFQHGGVIGVVSVGVQTHPGEILVYTKGGKTRPGVPSHWRGYPVRIVRSSIVSPAFVGRLFRTLVG
jgi:hypothetical protein